MALHREPKFPQFGGVFCCLTQQNPDCSAAQNHILLYFRFMLLHMSLRVFVFRASMSLDDWACIFQSWISFASHGSYLSWSSSMMGWEERDVPLCMCKCSFSQHRDHLHILQTRLPCTEILACTNSMQNTTEIGCILQYNGCKMVFYTFSHYLGY